MPAPMVICNAAAENIKYESLGATGKKQIKNCVLVRYSGDNVAAIGVRFFFCETDTEVAVRCFDLVKTNGKNTEKTLAEVNRQNLVFRFAKFCYDPDDNTVQAEMDAPIIPDTSGPVCCELLARMVSIVDDAYPAFMRALYA